MLLLSLHAEAVGATKGRKNYSIPAVATITNNDNFAGCATHFRSTRYRGRDLGVHLTYTKVYDGQPIDNSEFYPSQPSLTPIHQPRRDGRLG